jgi:SAM-dependent methyltransferase
MSVTDTNFAGSIPGLYDRYLGPLLFQPYAKEVARRAAVLDPPRILETAAGTGIVTEALHRSVLEAEITATDLNPAMLDIGAERLHSDKVSFQPADALDLPFAESSFDFVVCQFGAMFFPDRVKANCEARRVLSEGGSYLLVIWDSIERNPASLVAVDAVAQLFPNDPPNFFRRVPHGYSDPEAIRRDLLSAGFGRVDIETVETRSQPIGAHDAAIGLCQGTPLRNEIEERDSAMLGQATEAAAEALKSLERGGRLDSPLSALLVTAVK